MAQPCTDLTEAEEGACTCACSLLSPHSGSTPALHPRLTLPHHLHTSFTLSSHLHALRTHLTARFTPMFHPAFHQAHTHSTPTLQHLTPALECFAVIVSCLTMAHWWCACALMGQYLTCCGISCDLCSANIDHFSALQAAAALAGAPARGWRGSRRRWCFSGRRGSSSG